ncbi:hypothetical protein HOI83_02485 [Candidatus Uhrbacteria bacterium]|nr:hypothetical protein [Candidatus Uhrbacteria bacterium]
MTNELLEELLRKRQDNTITDDERATLMSHLEKVIVEMKDRIDEINEKLT